MRCRAAPRSTANAAEPVRESTTATSLSGGNCGSSHWAVSCADFQPGLVLLAILHARIGVEDQRRGDRRLLIAQHARGHDAGPRQRQRQQRQSARSAAPTAASAAAASAAGWRFARCLMNRSAGNSRCLGCCRMIRCSTIGTAIASAPPRNADVQEGHRAQYLAAAADQVFGQGPVELHAGVERHVVDAALKTFAAVRLAEGLDFAQVVARESCRRRPAASRASRALRIRSCRRTGNRTSASSRM